MITLDGTYSWVLSYTNKHNISGKVIESINTGDWTFCTSVKPEWNIDKLDMNISKFDPDLNRDVKFGHRGGIIVRNGRHTGIFNVLWPYDDIDVLGKYIKGEIWYETPEGEVKIAIMETRIFGDGWIDIIFSYNRSKKCITLSTREHDHDDWWKVEEMKINGEIINYVGSHVWIGCANAFESSKEQFYSGHIRCIGVFNSALSETDRDKFYEEYHDFKGIPKYFSRSAEHRKQVYSFEKMNPISFTNFKTTTPYKAFDFSGNGNHPIIYKKKWGVY